MLKFSARNSRKKVVYDMGCDKPSPRGGAGATALSSFDASSHWLDSVGPGTSWENTWRSGSVAGPKGKRKACNDKQVIYLKQIYHIGYCIYNIYCPYTNIQCMHHKWWNTAGPK